MSIFGGVFRGVTTRPTSLQHYSEVQFFANNDSFALISSELIDHITHSRKLRPAGTSESGCLVVYLQVQGSSHSNAAFWP